MPSTKTILTEDQNIARTDNAWEQAHAVPGIKTIHVMQSPPDQNLLLFLNAQTPVTKPISATSVPLDIEQTQAFKENN